jgi:hypothetical protein
MALKYIDIEAKAKCPKSKKSSLSGEDKTNWSEQQKLVSHVPIAASPEPIETGASGNAQIGCKTITRAVRPPYLGGNTLSAQKPWEAEKISRRTWYRRRAAKKKASTDE